MLVCALVSLAVMTSGLVWAQECIPGNTCKYPDCRCWDDPSPPGGFEPKDTPQIVLLSFEYAINDANVDRYTDIFQQIKNPNGCPGKGTFFVQKLDTDFGVVKELYDMKHEIGLTTPTGTVPKDADDWLLNYQEMKDAILGAGVPEESLAGARGPELFSGGDDQLHAMDKVGLSYDATCVSLRYSSEDNLLWPYTYDFPAGVPACTIGTTPTEEHKGKWQFLVADLEFDGQKCASPSACSPLIKTDGEAFDMLYQSFEDHYKGSRSPFVLYIDPLWLTVDYQLRGTLSFLEYVNVVDEDVWFLTTQQAMAWIKSPVPSANATDFAPWACK